MRSMLDCIKCIDNLVPDGECDCAVPMDICNVCKNGPLNEGEEFCDEHALERWLR